jgi:hypothetical protein
VAEVAAVLVQVEVLAALLRVGALERIVFGI